MDSSVLFYSCCDDVCWVLVSIFTQTVEGNAIFTINEIGQRIHDFRNERVGQETVWMINLYFLAYWTNKFVNYIGTDRLKLNKKIQLKRTSAYKNLYFQ